MYFTLEPGGCLTIPRPEHYRDQGRVDTGNDTVESVIAYKLGENLENQIAEAERLVAELEPNPAECEEVAAQVVD